MRVISLGSWLALGIHAASAQDVAGFSGAMELQGAPVEATKANPTASDTAMQGFDGDLPTAALSKLADAPMSAATGVSRSAKDAQIYKSISPSVVLIARQNAIGTGSLVSATGEIITNYHVVKGSGTVGVIFKPETEGAKPTRDDIKVGQVLKYDEIADLALVKVSEIPAGRQPLRLGSTEEISVGSDVHAIGHPTGEVWTYTTGVISQYRTGYKWSGAGEGVDHKADIIQTQTPINPGNSGGPLLGDSGNLIGVNSFKTNGGEGLAFAVSVDDVKRFLLRSGNRVAQKVVREQKTVSAAKSPEETKKIACTPKALSKFRNKADNAAVTTYDVFCTGKTSGEYVVPDKPTDPIFLRVDRNGDGKGDVIFVDLKRSGKWNISYWDESFNGEWTLVGYHEDGTLKPTKFESFAAYQKRLASNQ
jgi:S1-C subfamily serine protease